MEGFIRHLRGAQGRVTRTRNALEVLGVDPAPGTAPAGEPGATAQHVRNDIYEALLDVSEPLANKYVQAKTDLETPGRLSWSGSAHEIREVLRGLLEALAPDEEVTTQSWYKQDKQTPGPTQKQRVRYVLQERGAGSKEQKVAEKVDVIEDWVGDLARATYTRASDAAHRTKDPKEVRRIVRYFEAFAHDLLDLD